MLISAAKINFKISTLSAPILKRPISHHPCACCKEINLHSTLQQMMCHFQVLRIHILISRLDIKRRSTAGQGGVHNTSKLRLFSSLLVVDKLKEVLSISGFSLNKKYASQANKEKL